MSLVWVTGSQWLQAIPEVLSEGFGGLGYGRQMRELMCTWLLVSGWSLCGGGRSIERVPSLILCSVLQRLFYHVETLLTI